MTDSKPDSKKEPKPSPTTVRLKAMLKEVYSSVDRMTKEKQKSLIEFLKEWQHAQKRKHRRKPLREPVDYALGDRAFRGLIKNISVGGALIETPGDATIGQPITLTFALPGLEKPLKTAGKIVWKDAHGFGVQFVGMSVYVEQHLDKIIEAL